MGGRHGLREPWKEIRKESSLLGNSERPQNHYPRPFFGFSFGRREEKGTQCYTQREKKPLSGEKKHTSHIYIYIYLFFFLPFIDFVRCDGRKSVAIGDRLYGFHVRGCHEEEVKTKNDHGCNNKGCNQERRW